MIFTAPATIATMAENNNNRGFMRDRLRSGALKRGAKFLSFLLVVEPFSSYGFFGDENSKLVFQFQKPPLPFGGLVQKNTVYSL